MRMRNNYFKSLLAAALMLACVNAAAQTFTADGINYNVTSEADMACEVVENYQAGYSGDVVIPAQVTADGKTYTVTAVGENAFINDEVKSVKLPSTVTEIKNSAFYMCQNLTDVDLGGNVKTIGGSAFTMCPIASITLPETLESIGGQAFYMGKLSSVELPSSLKEIGMLAFGGTPLTSVVIPNSVTEVGDGAFMNCTSLKNAVVSNSVNVINSMLFNGCTALEDVTIGSSVTEILTAAFQSCTSLKTVTMMCTVPPTTYSDQQYPFNEVPIGNATLRVPAGSAQAYKAADTWKDFGTIVEFTPTGISNAVAATDFAVKASGGVITVSGVEGEVSVYDVSGAKVAAVKASGGATIAVPAHGIYVVKAGGKTVKVAM